jgi:hypothetical protein
MDAPMPPGTLVITSGFSLELILSYTPKLVIISTQEYN